MNVYMARQPIFDMESNVYAYELLYRSNGSVNSYNGADGDESTADVVTNAFFGLDIKSIIGESRAFINFTSNLLLRGIPKMISPDILVVEILENQMMGEGIFDAVADLKDRGYMIALDDFEYDSCYNELFLQSDLVKIDFRTSQKAIEETAYICRYCNKLMLAEKIESREEFEYAQQLGCNFTQGYYFAKPTLMSQSSIQPLPINFMDMMELVSAPESEIEIDEIVEVISRDTAMCQRLLRLINSVYFGVRNRVSSIMQALVILGLDYLREWVYLMGMQRITHNDNAEVMRTAVLTAKFCGKIAKLIPEAEPQSDSFYLMGLLSMVETEGGKALETALDEFPLTTDIKNGLLRRGGLFSDVYEMALFYMQGEWESFDKLTEIYGLDKDVVSALSLECVKEAERLKLL